MGHSMQEQGNSGGNGTFPPAANQAFSEQRYEAEPEARTVRDYLAVLWRRKWIILLVVVVATASAYAFSARQAKSYQAHADIIYEQSLDISNPLTQQTYTDPTERTLVLNSVASVLASPDMVHRAGVLLTPGGCGGDRFHRERRARHGHGRRRQHRHQCGARHRGQHAAPSGGRGGQRLCARVHRLAHAQRAPADPGRHQGAARAAPRCISGAARQTTDYLVLQQRLQDMQILKATANGNFRMLVPAVTPASPESPKPLRSALLGFGVGLFAAIGLAFLLEQFDTRLRRPEDVADVLRHPVLGRVPRISRRPSGRRRRRHPHAARQPRRRRLPPHSHQPGVHQRRWRGALAAGHKL